jgi:hypothetical protein
VVKEHANWSGTNIYPIKQQDLSTQEYKPVLAMLHGQQEQERMQQSTRFQEDDTELIAYAVQRAKEGGSLQSVTQDLIKLRIPPEKAKAIATEVCRAKQAAYRRQGCITFLVGLFFLAIGLGITWWTFSQAVQSGGRIYVMYGAIVLGALGVLRGLWRMVAG